LVRVDTAGDHEELIYPRARAARRSPDGRALAVRDDRGVVCIDLDGHGAKRLFEGAGVSGFGWDVGSRVVFVELAPEDEPTRLLPDTPHTVWRDARTGAEVGPGVEAPPAAPRCTSLHVEHEHATPCLGLDLVDGEGRTTPLVAIEGCGSSHFGPPAPWPRYFTADCEALVFDYDRQVFVVELGSRRVGVIAVGQAVDPL
jgi:hypothetical protein